jgi:hypothetical protein
MKEREINSFSENSSVRFLGPFRIISSDDSFSGLNEPGTIELIEPEIVNEISIIGDIFLNS